jgi:hypothetical protein
MGKGGICRVGIQLSINLFHESDQLNQALLVFVGHPVVPDEFVKV